MKIPLFYLFLRLISPGVLRFDRPSLRHRCIGVCLWVYLVHDLRNSFTNGSVPLVWSSYLNKLSRSLLSFVKNRRLMLTIKVAFLLLALYFLFSSYGQLRLASTHMYTEVGAGNCLSGVVISGVCFGDLVQDSFFASVFTVAVIFVDVIEYYFDPR